MNALRRLFGSGGSRSSPGVPKGHRLYGVGDIHGRYDLLEKMLAKIESDTSSRGKAQTTIIFLGDYIDRGPASKEVIERLRTYECPARLVFLSGNHEEVLLRILDGEAPLILDWLKFGGAECLQSYGIDPALLRQMSPDRAVSAVRDAVPRAHVEFLRSMDDTFRAGDYLFVHAGVRPGIALEEQVRSDLRWIREPFLSDSSEHGFVVVHGHTVREEVEEQPNRIGIDTGAYRYGILTAVGLEASDRWFVQATNADCSEEQLVRNRKVSSAFDPVSGQSG